MFLTEIQGLSSYHIDTEKSCFIEKGLSEIIIPINEYMPAILERFINNPFSISMMELYQGIKNMQWVFIEIHQILGKIIFVDNIERLNCLVKSDFVLENVTFINCEHFIDKIKWRYVYTKRFYLEKPAPEIILNGFCLLSVETLTFFYELNYYTHANQSLDNYIKNLPKFKILQSFYAKDNLSFQLLQLTGKKSYQDIIKASNGQDYPAIFISNFKADKLTGDAFDIDPTVLDDVFNHFQPNIGFLDDRYDGAYSCFYLKNGFFNIDIKSLNSQGVSEPVFFSHLFI